MAIEKRLLGTFETVLKDVPVAYSVLLRYEPPYTDAWEDDDGETRLEHYGSECAVELVRHEVGQDPLTQTGMVPAWVQLDYNDDPFPHLLDVEDCEWETLFDEAGREWLEFHAYKSNYPQRMHLISNILKAVGL
jgi:hypothetical protein